MSNILKYQNPSSPLLKPWKALEKMNYEAIPDSTFTRDKTGIGSIEYFSADNNNGITYLNGYHKAHPKPGTDVILYDPATNDQQDVRLDALHFMPKDPIYGALYDEYLLAARDGDVAYNADRLLQEYIDSDKLEQAFKTYDVKNISELRERLFLNEADGLLRNMFIEGTPEYIKSKRYYPDKTQLEQWNVHLMPYINNIKTYLETGVKPEHVIEPAVVAAYKKGGSIHIKKKNHGKFTEYCGGKVTEECITKGKKSKDPKIRKRATFAANARKWKHEKGGILKARRGTPKYGLHGGDPTYPKYGSHMAAKLAYDTGSRDPEAIGAAIPTRIRLDGSVEGGNVKNTTFTTVTNNNGSSNINFESKSTTSYNDGLYNTSHIGSSNNNGVINSYEHYSFGMPNGDRYHTFNNNGTLSDRYDVDFAKRLGMDKLPKLRMLE